MSGAPAGPVAGVVVPAAGSGSRMGGEVKQFRPLGGAPVLVQTLRAFARHPQVGPLVAAVPAPSVEAVGEMLADHGVRARVVAGGASRQASVAHGLAALPPNTPLALVHDAARPFVPQRVITQVIAQAHAHGAAAAALPVADTLRQGGIGPLFGDTVPRDGMWAMQTPQGARLGWLRRAYGHTRTIATDEAGLLQAVGYPVRIVEGDARNRKLTHASDWPLAEALWPLWAREERGERPEEDV